MKRWLTLLTAIALCLCMGACGDGGETAESQAPESSQEISLPDGVTLDENGNQVIELTYENWEQYFYFDGTVEPSGWGEGDKIVDFAAFNVIRIKEEYRSRTVACSFDIELSERNVSAYTVTYNLSTKETKATPCNETDWAAFDIDLPHTEERYSMEKIYSFSNENKDTGLVMYEDQKSAHFHRATLSADGNEYTIPTRLCSEYFIRYVQGSITLAE